MNYNVIVITIVLIIVTVADCTENNLNLSNSDSQFNETSTLMHDNTSNVKNQPMSTYHYEASGLCYHTVDGDTIDVKGVGRIRFVGVDTPERGQKGYDEAKDYVESMCLGKTVYLDIDNAKHYDKYGRTLAVVYVDNTNLNAELLKKGYAKVLYIPPSEFNPYSWT